MTLLPEAEIRSTLESLPGWEFGGDHVVKQYTFASFRDAIAFINRVADVAEARNHHPELTSVYSRVRVSLSTHDAGGVTDKDIDLARRIEEVSAGA